MWYRGFFAALSSRALAIEMLSLLLILGPNSQAELLRWEGDFSGEIDLSTSEQPVQLTGQWAYEIDRRDLKPTFPGSTISNSIGQPTSFEISPAGWGSTTFTPDRVDIKVNTFTGTTTLAGAQIAWNGLVTASSQDDFNAIYRNTGIQRIIYSEASVPSIPEATSVAGSIRRVEPEPYVMGEFSGRFPESMGLGTFSGRWAIDLENLQLPPGTNTFKPLRYLNITGDYPGSESFVLDQTQAWVVTDGEGDLLKLMIGFDRPNGMRNLENDFWVDYDVEGGLASFSGDVGISDMQVASATAFTRIVDLGDTTGSLTVVPEPSGIILLAGAGGVMLTRRRR